MSFEQKLIWFWALLFGALWFLRRRPGSIFAQAALTWIGPLPTEGELWSRFQLRWASYACGWFLQFAVALSLLYVASRIWPGAADATWFNVLYFALPIGIGMALLAAIGFSLKAAKAHWFGPNPAFQTRAHGNGEA
jgi:hypothetical protein